MRTAALLLVVALGCAGSRPPSVNFAAARAHRSDAHKAYAAKDFRSCVEHFGQAAAADPAGAAEDEYGQACCLALAGDRQAALARLESAVERGFRERGHLEADGDLEALRDDPRWRAIVARAQANADRHYEGANPELRRLHDEDQADRRPGPAGINWDEVRPRDVARRARVREILDGGGARVAADYHHAAMVFQHGEEVADFRLAHELAVKAAELDPANRQSRWLAAAAKDRELMTLGKPQLYGTQFRKVGDRWELYQTDPTVTDDERARWNVPPLAEAKQRAGRMNQGR
jgi:hypothetical protein